MATAKRELTNPAVHGAVETISLEQAGMRLGCMGRDVMRFLRDHYVSYVQVGDEMAIDAAAFEAALAGRMTRAVADRDYRAVGAELAQRTRSAQGLPSKVSDPSIIAKVVALVRSRDDD